MAGMSAQDVASRTVDADPPPAAAVAESENMADPTPAAPHRVIDPAAREIAARLLGEMLVEVSAAEPARQPSEPQRFRLVGLVVDELVMVERAVLVGRGERTPASDTHQLFVPLAIVSRQHCLVEQVGAQLSVTDLGSANGTQIVRGVDQIVVGAEPIALSDGDVLATAHGLRHLVRVELATS